MSCLALSASFNIFKYLCNGSTVITNILIPTVRGSTLDVRIYRRRIPRSKVDPCAERVKALKYFYIKQETKRVFLNLKSS